METIILRSRDEFNDITLKNIKLSDDITFIIGQKKESKDKALQCIGFADGWNEKSAKMWYANMKKYLDEIVALPDEAAGEWIELYDNFILDGDDSYTAAEKAWEEIKKRWGQSPGGEWIKLSDDWRADITKSNNPIIEVFRAGKYPQGDLDVDDLDKMIGNYDPTVFKAPVTVDHSQVGPALGWVSKIFRVGESLFAVLENLTTKFLEKIKNKQYMNRSIEVFRLTHKDVDYWPYFGAVTFLGAGTPAVKGMEEPIFISMKSRQDLVTKFNDAELYSIDRPELIGFPIDVTESSIRIQQKNPSLFDKDSFRTITLKGVSGVKAVIGKLKGETTTTIQTFIFDKSKWNLEKAKAWVKEHGGKYSQDPNLYEDTGGKKLGEITLAQEELDSKLKAAREAGIAEGHKVGKEDADKESETKFSEEKSAREKVENENKALKEQIAEQKKADLQKFTESEYDRLLKAKKLIPAKKDYFFKMVEKLSADEEEIQFSEKEKLTPVKAFIKNIEEGPDMIDPSKKIDPDDPNKKSFNTDRFKGTQFEDAPELTKKRMIFVEEKLAEWKVEKGAANYRDKEREAIRLSHKEVTE